MSGLSQPVSDFKYLKRAKNGGKEPEDVTERVLAVLREKAPKLLGLVAFTEVFDSSGGGAARMCVEKGVPFLGKVPLDPQLCKTAEEGKSCFGRDECWISASAFSALINKLLKNNAMA
ncbi:putative mrp/NBP35 ATP-binding protein [Helianthus annuus]|uniref:Putative mrp/NBP35 ATP-binding protein, P-loop containing nucleoside triphosphate hydrolase n=2 Tax=Helianthus annuus TaxID=4232 RepID=A0A251UQ29_HELAN|nr:putative mrp/NBP35 ATP-binding protein [Helianthus annuus]